MHQVVTVSLPLSLCQGRKGEPGRQGFPGPKGAMVGHVETIVTQTPLATGMPAACLFVCLLFVCLLFAVCHSSCLFTVRCVTGTARSTRTTRRERIPGECNVSPVVIEMQFHGSHCILLSCVNGQLTIHRSL